MKAAVQGNVIMPVTIKKIHPKSSAFELPSS
jgi:hypothetical protein